MEEPLKNAATVDAPVTEEESAASYRATTSPLPLQHSASNAPAEADWHRQISEAAYYLAAKRNFNAGAELEDWLAAEAAAKDFLKSSTG
jgi:hypothetical protein